MALIEDMRAALTAAMKRRDEITTSTLRMALSAVKAAEVSGASARTLSDADIVKVLAKEAKRRDEAADVYTQVGRQDRADRELAERAVLAAYIPSSVEGPELEALVDAVLAESGVTVMGAAMKAIQAELAGRPADGKVLADLVKSKLASRALPPDQT